MPTSPPARTRVAMDLTPLLGPLTGVGRVVFELVTGLRDRSDVELRGFALTWRGRERFAGVVDGVPTGRALPGRPFRLLWSHLDRPTIRYATGPVDVVHGVNFTVPPGGRAVEVVTVHDLTAWHYPHLVHESSLAYPRLLERSVRRGGHVHVVSRYVAGEVADLGVPPERIHVVPNGVTAPPAGDAARGRRLAAAERYLLAVGTVEPRKDYPGLVRAVAQLAPSHPDLALVIAGGEGWGRDDLDRAVAASGLGDRVRRLGYVSDQDRADLLAGAAVLVYPSVYEGFGLVPLEGMAAGVPVVATTAGAVPEVVGDAAELCPVQDDDALAGALARVLDDEQRADELVERGHRQVLRYPWSRSVEEMAGLYRRLATG